MIQRVNTYLDSRFSQNVLNQHGCFLVDGVPYEVEIISDREAVVRGHDKRLFPDIIEEFRFFTPHISVFYNENGEILQHFSPAQLFAVTLESIQPSQFFVDEEKLAAVATFLHKPDDIIIQVMKHGNRYISLDGHTRLYHAVIMGWTQVQAVEDQGGTYALDFAEEARTRNVYSPYDLQVLSHQEYTVKWDQFCDNYFLEKKRM